MNSKATKTTVSLPNLLVDGSDAEFRELIALLYATSGRLQAMRRELAKALSVSIAEFSVLTALMYLEQHETRIRVRTVADHLRVSGAQVTAIVRKLGSNGWVDKKTDPDDSRAVSLSLTSGARKKLATFAPFLRAVNDRWFDGMTRREFEAVGKFLQRIVRQYDGANAKALDLQHDRD